MAGFLVNQLQCLINSDSRQVSSSLVYHRTPFWGRRAFEASTIDNELGSFSISGFSGQSSEGKFELDFHLVLVFKSFVVARMYLVMAGLDDSTLETFSVGLRTIIFWHQTNLELDIHQSTGFIKTTDSDLFDSFIDHFKFLF